MKAVLTHNPCGLIVFILAACVFTLQPFGALSVTLLPQKGCENEDSRSEEGSYRFSRCNETLDICIVDDMSAPVRTLVAFEHFSPVFSLAAAACICRIYFNHSPPPALFPAV